MTREIKLRENVIVKINGSQAEVIVENKYRLFLTLYENNVTAKYSDVELSIEYDKFDAEKLARKIHTIVQQSHKFSILLIKEVLELIKINNLYDEIIREIKKFKKEENVEALLKIYDFLSKSQSVK
jgi:hypothetical protein